MSFNDDTAAPNAVLDREPSTARTLENIGALWETVDGGRHYFSGNITLPSGEKLQIRVFENLNAGPSRPLAGRRRPDWIVFTPIAEVVTDEPF